MLVRTWPNLEPSYTTVVYVEWCGCCEKVWQFLKNLNIELLHDPAILLLGVYSREIKLTSTQNFAHEFRNIIIHNSQNMAACVTDYLKRRQILEWMLF